MASWALGVENCSATLITPRVALTTRRCAYRARYPVGGAALKFTQRRTGRVFDGQVEEPPSLAHLTPDGLALVRFAAGADFGTQGAPIPGYAEERRLLRGSRSGDALRAGGRLHAFATTRYDRYAWEFGTGREDRSFDDITRPLSYVPLRRLRTLDPHLFRRPPGGAANPDDLLDRRLERALSDCTSCEADRLLIPSVGRSADGMTLRSRPAPTPGQGRWSSPFLPEDEGGGLMATLDAAGVKSPHGGLVGLVAGDGLLHPRLSAHWPAIHAAMIEKGWAEDAGHLARQVLKLKTLDDSRRGRVGQFFAQPNPFSDRLEFFRLRRVEVDGSFTSYPMLPLPGQSTVWWQYLGTDLPTRESVRRMQVEDRAALSASRASRASDVQSLNRLPGTAPALPAPEAARR